MVIYAKELSKAIFDKFSEIYRTSSNFLRCPGKTAILFKISFKVPECSHQLRQKLTKVT